MVNKVLVGTKTSSFERKRKLLNRIDGIHIEANTKVVGPVEIYGQLTIGENCWIGKNFCINGNGAVVIGDNCDIGPEVVFQTGGHTIGNAKRRAGGGVLFRQTVGNGTWIGGRSTILNNVTIGEGCVIAGCSCVTKDVAGNTLVGGIPAKFIRVLENES